MKIYRTNIDGTGEIEVTWHANYKEARASLIRNVGDVGNFWISTTAEGYDWDVDYYRDAWLERFEFDTTKAGILRFLSVHCGAA